MQTMFQHAPAIAGRLFRYPGKSSGAGLLALCLLLAGCSTVRLVDSDVTAFASQTAQPIALPAGYRFERLPSQQAQGQGRTELEALAEPELAKAGLRRDDSAPRYSLQLEARLSRDPLAPWDEPRFFARYGAPYPVFTRFGTVWRAPPLMLPYDFPNYRREVHLVLRRIADNQVVFESRARHDGPWPDSEQVLPAMLQAALQGFPNPPPGPRRVAVEIPR